MTLVFERERSSSTKAVTHALIVGCGYFPHLPVPDGKNADYHHRLACPDSAREMVKFLVENRDRLLAPLSSVRCLITEANGDPGYVPKTHPQFDPRDDERVEKANTERLKHHGDGWIDACQPKEGEHQGDHMFFYACSHGIADRDETAFLLLEDIYKSSRAKWRNALNVGALASELPWCTRAGACWIFMDACQEILPQVVSQIGGVTGWKLVSTTIEELAIVNKKDIKSAASLAASSFGTLASAPKAGGATFFTKALIEALGECCMELDDQGKWMTSAKEVIFGIEKLVKILFNQINVEYAPLSKFNEELFFLHVSDPKIPVVITTVPGVHIKKPGKILEKSSGKLVHSKKSGNIIVGGKSTMQWLVHVSPMKYFKVNLGSKLSGEFYSKPPAKSFEVK